MGAIQKGGIGECLRGLGCLGPLILKFVKPWWNSLGLSIGSFHTTGSVARFRDYSICTL